MGTKGQYLLGRYGAVCSSRCPLQAEVWDLEMLRSNYSTWPVDVSQIKQGFIVVKGHSTVSQ